MGCAAREENGTDTELWGSAMGRRRKPPLSRDAKGRTGHPGNQVQKVPEEDKLCRVLLMVKQGKN